MSSISIKSSVQNPNYASAAAPKQTQKRAEVTKPTDQVAPSKTRRLINAVSPSKGLSLTAKVVGGSVAGAGILAFAGYGMFAAAPHISALVGTIAAAHVTVPLLITIGAVLGAVGIVMAIRKIYKTVQKKKLITANNEAAKRSAEAALSKPAEDRTLAVKGPAEATQPQAVVASFDDNSSVRSQSTQAALSPLEQEVQYTIANQSEEETQAAVAQAKVSLASYKDYFANHCTASELAGDGDADKLAEISQMRQYQEQCEVLIAMAPDAAVYV